MSTMTAGGLSERLAALRATEFFANYEWARENVLAMYARDSADGLLGTASDYWEDELGGFDYLFDASPLMVAKLRHQTYHVTGIKPYDYRQGKDKGCELLRGKLEALIEVAGGDDLLVPEAPELGGFGHEIDGKLYNVDTLKYFEVLIAMRKAGVLGPLREQEERPIVLEVGSGWGGFPNVFKQLVPRSTYVIFDLPPLFLFSATYLKTRFPKAKFVFVGGADDINLEEQWADADFVFVPNTRFSQVVTPRLDLALNMVSFQEMTTEQVDGYMAWAHRMGAQFLYSLNRERSRYNDELLGVSRLLERYFWPHEIDVLDISYTKLAPGKAKKRKKSVAVDPRETNDYRHIVGWRRVLL